LTLRAKAALKRQQKEEARAQEPPEQTAKRRQQKFSDALRYLKVAAEAKKTGICKSEVRSKIACRKAIERSKTLTAKRARVAAL
jgi:hypothetical protein